MTVPQHRRDITDKQNLMWLLRNLGIQNSQNEHFERAINLIKRIQIEQ